MKKSVNLILDEEIKRLKQALIEAVNGAALPASVKKLVVESTVRDICLALQNMTDNERIKLAQEQETEDKGDE